MLTDLGEAGNNSIRRSNGVDLVSVCPLCACSQLKSLGLRGNREYFGANKSASPHLVTNVMRCNNCSFIFCNPSLRCFRELEKNHYDSLIKDPTESPTDLFHDFNYGLMILSRYKNSGSLLDVGAGTGEFVYCANGKGFRAKGIEPSYHACDFARTKYDVNIVNGFLEETTSLSEEVFDVVTMFHVLEHADDCKELLRIVKSRMTSDGILYVEVPNANSALLKVADFLFWITGRRWSTRLSPAHPPFHKIGFCPRSLKFLLEHTGFEIMECSTFTAKRRCRSSATGKVGIGVFFRNIASSLFSLLPNREIVYALSRSK